LHELRRSIMKPSLTARAHGNRSGIHRASTDADMLTMTEVRTLVRELSTTNVLSVYLDTHATDAATRDAWRPALGAALGEVGVALSGDEAAEFQRAVTCLEEAALPGSDSWESPGWMVLATASGVRFAAQLPVRTSTMVVWREGPVIAPYLRARQCAVMDAIVPSTRRKHESAQRWERER
jgi:hypothetical protein